MIGSAYSRISKLIGLGPKQVSLPSAGEVRAIVKRAGDGDETAFAQLFNIYRHRESPKNEAELAIINIVAKGFRDTENIYRNIP